MLDGFIVFPGYAEYASGRNAFRIGVSRRPICIDIDVSSNVVLFRVAPILDVPVCALKIIRKAFPYNRNVRIGRAHLGNDCGPISGVAVGNFLHDAAPVVP